MTEEEFYAALSLAFEAGMQFATDNPNLSSLAHQQAEQTAWDTVLASPEVLRCHESFEGY